MGKCDNFGAIVFFNDLVIEGTLLAADRLAAQLFPIVQLQSFWCQQVGARSLVVTKK